MSGSSGWTPEKVTAVAARLITYAQARNALSVLASPGAKATVSLYVSSGDGSANFDFQLDIDQATAFFTPVVGGIESELTSQGVDLTPPAPPPPPAIQPIVSDITPSSGSDTGDTVVTLTGSGLSQITSISVDGAPVSQFAVVNDGEVTFTMPAHADGAVDVTVQNSAGTSAPVQFTYAPPAP